jgi:hypothetical protein
MPRWFVVGCVVASAGCGVLWGCGSNNEEMICDDDGCRICDAYGCRPAAPGSGGTAAGTGGTAGTSGMGGTAGTAGTSGMGGAGGAGADADVTPSCDPSTALCPCGPGGACDDGLACLDGVCLSPCEYSSECGASRICVNGRCVVGCDATVPCPDGYICGSLGTCEVDPGTSGCGGSNPCPGGLLCVGGVCQGVCETTDDCAPGEVCNGATGTCMADPQPTRPCAEDPLVCNANQVCVDGYCRYPCTDGTSCQLIDARIPVCEAGICMSQAEANPECTKQDDCPSGQDCVSNVCK